MLWNKFHFAWKFVINKIFYPQPLELVGVWYKRLGHDWREDFKLRFNWDELQKSLRDINRWKSWDVTKADRNTGININYLQGSGDFWKCFKQ